jgi:hypothetical protein
VNLYEITTGYTGESYCRAYAWAKDDVEALKLFWETNPGVPTSSRGPVVKLILKHDDKPFCTRLSSSGWDGGP